MASTGASPKSPPARRDSPLGWLGHRIARHPWYSLFAWTAVLLICLVPAINVGSVLTGSFSNPLPSSDQSVQADHAYAAEFPNAQSAPSSAIVLLEAAHIVGPVGKNATLGITANLSADPQLRNVSSIESLYSAYSEYLAGQVLLGWGFLGPALAAAPSLPSTVNDTAVAVWAPVSAYIDHWNSTVANLTNGTPDTAADLPAYNLTRAEFASSPTQAAVLADFYTGDDGTVLGFNASLFGGCLSTRSVTTCANDAVRTALPSQLSTLFPAHGASTVAQLVVADLELGNWSASPAQQGVGATLLGSEVGIAPAWLLMIWQTFPGPTPPSVTNVTDWVQQQVLLDPIGRLPLPVPSAIYTAFVNPSASATIIVVSFNASDTFEANGSSATYHDVTEIRHVVNQTLGWPRFAPIASYETGAAPLDDATSYLATSAIGLLFVLTIIVLLVIMVLYFRAPSAPALAFGMIGIALGVSFAMIFVTGKLVTTFNSMIESIVLVFLMSIGTDYSVFLLARYREELVKGTPSTTAVETTVRWAGQSILTSGLAVLVVAGALTFSGISFLSQLGICLLIAVASALVVNLTVLPAILALIGPRVFWPNSGARFARYAERRTQSIRTEKDLVGRAGRVATRRPVAVVLLILVISAPVLVVALQVPVSYDITNIGLPTSNPAEIGYTHLTNDFGIGSLTTSYALVTFAAPVTSGGVLDAPEVQDVAGLQAAMNRTPGVASVTTFVGPGSAPLDTWLNYSSLPPAVQIALNQSLASYVGTDGSTVRFTIETNMSGYSAPAVGVIDHVRQRMDAYDAAHPGVTQILLGGAAPTTQDIQSLVNRATEEMLIGAAIGLFVLMLAILGSAFVPILALGVIGLSILWSWAGTYLVVGILENEALVFLLPLILLILVLGLGMDYNVLLLTRVQEERALGNRGVEAIRDAVTHAGGVITAAAVILGGAFLLLGFTAPLGMIAAIGLGIGFAVLLQAFVVQLFFTPAVLTLGKDRIWKGWKRSR